MKSDWIVFAKDQADYPESGFANITKNKSLLKIGVFQKIAFLSDSSK